MKLNAILPFLIPVIIVGGLIGYNEMNNNVLIKQLSNKTQITKNNEPALEGNLKDVSSGISTNISEVNKNIDVINDNQSYLVKDAEFILDKINYVQTLDSVEQIDIPDEDYNKIISASNSIQEYAKSFYENPTENKLNLSGQDIQKIQNANSFAPTLISLLDNANKIQNKDYNKCDSKLVDSLSSCSPYTCEVYHEDLGILSPYKVLGKNTIGNCGYSYTYNKLPFICGLNETSKEDIISFLNNEIEKETTALSYDPNKLPATYTTIDGEQLKQLDGCIMVALGGQLEQFQQN